jgi:hypothetical protein
VTSSQSGKETGLDVAPWCDLDYNKKKDVLGGYYDREWFRRNAEENSIFDCG